MWTYDLRNNPLTHKDRGGISEVMTYDKEDRLLTFTRGNSTQTTNTYDPNGNLETQRDGNNHLTTHQYDAANQKIRSTLSDQTDAWTYTATNQIKTHTDRDGRTTTFEYDPRDRLIKETNAENEARTYTYDLNNNRTLIQLPNGRRWTQTFDAADRLTSVKTPENHTTTFTHHPDDQFNTITDANGHTVTLTSDALARIASRAYPGGATFTTLFDGEGNARNEQHPDSSITRSFDALNRATAEAFAGDAALNLTTTFDPRGNPLTHTETQAGRTLASTRRFDDLNRLEGDQGQASAHAPAIPNAYRHSQRYALDGNGNRTSETDANGTTTTRTFDAFNRILTSTTPGEGTTTNTWNGDGTLASVSHSNGTATRNTYDRAGRKTSVTHTKNGATTLSFVYSYDPNGNRTREVRTQAAMNGQAGSITTTIHTFDGDDRHLSETITHQPPSLTTPDEKKVWTLDGVGNRLTEVVTRTATNTITSSKVYLYSPRNQLLTMTDAVNQLSVAYTYSGNGNQTSRTVTQQGQPAQTTTYTFDARDRLIQAQPNAPNTANAPTLRFVYDADGRRVERIAIPSGGGTPTATLYLYNGQTLLHEADPANDSDGLSISDTYRHSAQLDRHIAYAQSGGTDTRYYQLDGLNTPVALTDGNGDTVTRTAYSAYGEIEEQTANGVTQAPWQLPNYNPDVTGQAALLSNDDQSIGFVGMVKDEVLGLYVAGNGTRYYDPLVGSFNAMDTFAGDPAVPITYNAYLYGHANPLRHTDGSGRCSLEGSFRCGLEQSVAMAPNDQARKVAQGVLAVHDAEVAGRRNAPATGIANSFVNATRAAVQLGADALYVIPEAVLSDDADLGSRVRFIQALQGISEFVGSPIDTTRQNYVDGLARAQAIRDSGDEFATTVAEYEAHTDIAGTALGAGALARSGVRAGLRHLESKLPDYEVNYAAHRSDAEYGLSTAPVVTNVPEQAVLGTVAVENKAGVETQTVSAPVETQSNATTASVLPGQTMSAFPQGRRVGGRGESPRSSDPPSGTQESGAWEPTQENIARMEAGRPPLGVDGLPVELHHRGQNPAGPLDEMSATTHDGVPHPLSPSQIDRSQFAGERARYWRGRVRELNGQQ